MINVKQLVRVQPGHRVEVFAPEFSEGELVDVIVRSCSEPTAATQPSLLAFLDSLPDVLAARDVSVIGPDGRDRRAQWLERGLERVTVLAMGMGMTPGG